VNRRIVIALCLAGAAMLRAVGGSMSRQPRPAPAPPAVPATAPSPRPAIAPPRRADDFALSGEQTQGGWLRGTVPAGAASLALDGRPIPIAPDGSFFIAFDRDAGAAAALVARLADGSSRVRSLAIAPRAWKLEHISIGPRPGAVPSEEFKRRRAAELVQINAARAIDTQSQGWRQRFIWPVRGRISGLFGSQRIYRGTPGSYHSGTDIAGGAGTTFVAPADGVVILAASSPFTLEGNLLMIDHGMGLNSAFLHCSQLLVREGEAVKQGQPIGRIGMTGRATGPHLHWSIKWRNARLDPMLFAGPMR
jgi:murein DD-endopeptidase MepM/ murein hydrolase activator NlpD